MNQPNKIPFLGIQALLWILVIALNFFVLMQHGDPPGQALNYTLNRNISFIIIIYGNALWLIPKFYHSGRKVTYVVISLVSLAFLTYASASLLAFVKTSIHTELSFTRNFVGPGWRDYFLTTVTSFTVVYIFSITFRYVLDFNHIKQKQQILIKEHAEAQLHLLKSQVQPHFLFNTLNNIYSAAYRESAPSAAMIERLAGIMRYFVDESPKHQVSLATEMQFLEDYIFLEKIRVRYPLELNVVNQVSRDIHIHPMLLMPLVENIFKHGIDKDERHNKVDIRIAEEGNKLIFKTENKLYRHQRPSRTGSGIQNLEKRLALLYGDESKLTISENGQLFKARLEIPVL
jgi:hypothetical protein